jgi:hypothetical protein
MHDDPRPVTAVSVTVSVRKRMSTISEERWNRLQREFRAAVWAEYPNPGRKDCPGLEALRDLAERMVLREDLERDPRWKHAVQCGPCYEEYIALKDKCSVASSKSNKQSNHPRKSRRLA